MDTRRYFKLLFLLFLTVPANSAVLVEQCDAVLLGSSSNVLWNTNHHLTFKQHER